MSVPTSLKALVAMLLSALFAVGGFYLLGTLQPHVANGGPLPLGVGPYMVTNEHWDTQGRVCQATFSIDGLAEDCFVAVARSSGGPVEVRANGEPLDQHLDHLSADRQVSIFSLDPVMLAHPSSITLEVRTDRWSRSDALYLGSESGVFDAFFLLERTLRTIALTAVAVMFVYVLSLFLVKRNEQDLVPFIAYTAFLIGWLLVVRLPMGEALAKPLNFLQVCGHFYVAYIPTCLCVLLSGTKQPEILARLVRWYSLIGVPLLCGLIAFWGNFGLTMTLLLVLCCLWGGWSLCSSVRRATPGMMILVIGFGCTMGCKIGAVLVDCGVFLDCAALLALRKARLLNLPMVMAIMLYLNQLMGRTFQRTETMNSLLEEMVAQRTANLEQQQSMRLGMMINIFHDLRGPLFSIQKGLEVLPGRPADTSYTAVVAMLKERTRSLGCLIEDLFTAAKLEDQEYLLAEDPVAMEDVLLRVCQGAQPLAQERRVSIDLNIGAPCTAWGDEQYLLRAFNNLLENAVHHASPGSIVHVALIREHGQAAVSFSNSGPGIAPDALPHVFERYWRRGPRAAHEGSSGVGLSIVKTTIERHGGSVEATSAPGVGTQFNVRLPILEDADTEADSLQDPGV